MLIVECDDYNESGWESFSRFWKKRTSLLPEDRFWSGTTFIVSKWNLHAGFMFCFVHPIRCQTSFPPFFISLLSKRGKQRQREGGDGPTNNEQNQKLGGRRLMREENTKKGDFKDCCCFCPQKISREGKAPLSFFRCCERAIKRHFLEKRGFEREDSIVCVGQCSNKENEKWGGGLDESWWPPNGLFPYFFTDSLPRGPWITVTWLHQQKIGRIYWASPWPIRLWYLTMFHWLWWVNMYEH